VPPPAVVQKKKITTDSSNGVGGAVKRKSEANHVATVFISDDSQPLGGSQCSPDLVFVGLENPPDAVLCAFNSLLQAWFYIVAFRNAVFSSTSQDNSLNELKTVFHCLQKRRRDICVNVIVFIIVIWI